MESSTSFLFVNHLPSSLNGTQPKPATYIRKLVRLDSVCPKSGVCPLPINTGLKNYLFWRLRNLTASLTAYRPNFGMKHDVHRGATALKTARVLLHVVKMSWTFVHKRLKIGPEFLSSLCKFCILYFIARLRRRRSAKGTQSNFAKRWTVNLANNMP